MGFLILFGVWIIINGILTGIRGTLFNSPGSQSGATASKDVNFVNAALQIFTYLVLLLLPMPLLTSLNMPWRQKGMVMIIFVIGSL
jgi:hypothetical protein